jgi:hypothetical protein
MYQYFSYNERNALKQKTGTQTKEERKKYNQHNTCCKSTYIINGRERLKNILKVSAITAKLKQRY